MICGALNRSEYGSPMRVDGKASHFHAVLLLVWNEGECRQRTIYKVTDRESICGKDRDVDSIIVHELLTQISRGKLNAADSWRITMNQLEQSKRMLPH